MQESTRNATINQSEEINLLRLAFSSGEDEKYIAVDVLWMLKSDKQLNVNKATIIKLFTNISSRLSSTK